MNSAPFFCQGAIPSKKRTRKTKKPTMKNPQQNPTTKKGISNFYVSDYRLIY